MHRTRSIDCPLKMVRDNEIFTVEWLSQWYRSLFRIQAANDPSSWGLYEKSQSERVEGHSTSNVDLKYCRCSRTETDYLPRSLMVSNLNRLRP